MSYTLGEAARASGKSKPTIAKAIKAGRVSAVRAEDGSYQIDPTELHRVYPMTVAANGKYLQQDTPRETAVAGGELEKWRALATEREEVIRELRADKEDLRRRLDQASALLTDQRPSEARRSWWRRMFR
jgi:hypothetical protein